MIVRSAIKFYLASDYKHKNPIIMTELRHADIYEQMFNLHIIYEKSSIVEGFITDEDKFIDRYDAVYVARAANQVSIDFNESQLFSEDIWPEE